MFKDKTTRKQRMQKKEDREMNFAYALLIVITLTVLLAQILHWTPLQINL